MFLFNSTGLGKAYTQLWMSLSGEALSPKRALSRLDRYFSQGDPSRDFVVLLVDELDYMVRHLCSANGTAQQIRGLGGFDGYVLSSGGNDAKIAPTGDRFDQIPDGIICVWDMLECIRREGSKNFHQR